MTMIVKIQRSLSATASHQQVLIYNEPKTVVSETEMTPELTKWLGDRDKVYAKASLKKGHLTILGLVKAQPW